MNFNLLQLKKEDLSHSIMLVSNDKCALLEGAVYIAKMLMCTNKEPCNQCIQCKKIEHKNHADIIYYPKEKENITVDEMLQVVDDAQLSPYESDKKVYILNNFSETNVLAQNKLLKTLEEPKNNIYFILNVTNETKVLSTIKSRCRIIHLPIYSNSELEQCLNEFQISEQLKNDIISYCNGIKSKAIYYAQKEDFSTLLDFVIDLWTNMRHSQQMLKYASKLYNMKNDFEDFMFLYYAILQDVLYVKTNEMNLVKNQSRLSLYQEIVKDFSVKSLVNITKYCCKMNEEKERNCNQNIMVDNFLMKVLEERSKC